eukprot:TRINITY_DN24274_c0_g1_i1.p1 TRINITY_DN24274_c0_g1~~TRINITY_DN24274_c0_g1_i1.p1  ORF type:complete len:482 (-),score=103.43 TRINITY_DN24274_c0_g1_i1:46-1491(-)
MQGDETAASGDGTEFSGPRSGRSAGASGEIDEEAVDTAAAIAANAASAAAVPHQPPAQDLGATAKPVDEMAAAAAMEAYIQSLMGFHFAQTEDVTAYLRSFGYRPLSDARGWEVAARWPRLTVRVRGHAEFGGHTYYNMVCRLTLTSCSQAAAEWGLRRRLTHLRTGLHDPVKQDLDQLVYGRLFGNTRFASRLGLPGTTLRLDAWCRTLARSIGAGELSPTVTAKVLKCLGAPLVGASVDASGGCVARGPPIDACVSSHRLGDSDVETEDDNASGGSGAGASGSASGGSAGAGGGGSVPASSGASPAPPDCAAYTVAAIGLDPGLLVQEETVSDILHEEHTATTFSEEDHDSKIGDNKGAGFSSEGAGPAGVGLGGVGGDASRSKQPGPGAALVALRKERDAAEAQAKRRQQEAQVAEEADTERQNAEDGGCGESDKGACLADEERRLPTGPSAAMALLRKQREAALLKKEDFDELDLSV